MKTEDFVKQIMKSNDVYYDYNVVTENSVEINVELGDWKHDHLCIDRLMEKNGFNKVDEEVTFDDGSDVYYSTHRYQRSEVDNIPTPNSSNLVRSVGTTSF